MRRFLRSFLRVLVIVLLVPVFAYGALALVVGRDNVWATVFGPGNRAPVDFATLQPADTPNRYLVCPPAQCARADAESPVYPVPADRLRAAWTEVIAKHGAKLLSSGEEQIDAEARTPWLRFPDLVTVRIVPLGADRSTAKIYSRSLYGRSDLGVNAARVKAWMAEVEAGLRTMS
ncbi:DUF1499 domain-containing protein [Azospirillum canadense]|uniref:DUF1499 domain-containing protein n=1 Tax=Azospirillum canadense TaxID=403962 RepID=UPI0022276166|nr:DUF1499 domain-containing protein [Azospirillum canadense]MCW2236418.1 uncharacterized protein (DUF1499 family) [Azospirillum canadense]